MAARCSDRDVMDPSQAFLAAQHPEPVQVDTRQLGAEVAARGDDTLHLRVPDGRMIYVGVGKGHNGTVRHIKGPPLCSLSREA